MSIEILNSECRKVAALLAMRARTENWRSIVVTSPSPGQGTTTVTMRLAESLSQDQAIHPLVVELKPRSVYPSLSSLCSLTGQGTLRSMAEDEMPLNDCVQKTSKGVSVLSWGASGEPIPDTLTVLERLVEQADNFDLVLFEAPAIAEPEAIAAVKTAKRVVVVAGAEQTTFDSLREIQRDVKAHRSEMTGLILNRVRSPIPSFLDRAFFGGVQ